MGFLTKRQALVTLFSLIIILLLSLSVWRRKDKERIAINMELEGSIPRTSGPDVATSFDNEMIMLSLDTQIHGSAARNRIPKILHQSWKNNTLPPKYAKYRSKWLKMQPNWYHHLWTDEENRELVRNHYHWFLPIYDSFPVGVMRADTMRYLYMHHYGGIYCDLDLEPLKSLDPLIGEIMSPVVAAYLGPDYGDIADNIPPVFLMSEPGHILWMFVIKAVIQATKMTSIKETRPDYITGPGSLARGILAYAAAGSDIMMEDNWVDGSPYNGSTRVGDITILPPGLIYPFHWNERDTETGKICWGKSAFQDEEKCKQLYPNAYTITYHSFSWQDDWLKVVGD